MKFLFKKASDMPTKPKPTQVLPDNLMYVWDPNANDWIILEKNTTKATPPLYDPNNQNASQTTSTTTYTPIKSSIINSLNQFLDGDKYSKEIKIEKGLISDGLIKLAGINPIRGPKYSITDKGLNLLKQVAQEEHDFEKEYVNARKSYLLDGISESEFQTGAPEEQGQMPKFSVFEKDGSELAQVEAENSTDAKVKFIMEHPEYEGSQTIEVKEVKAKEQLKVGDRVKVVMPDNEVWNNYTGIIEYIEGNNDFDTVIVVGDKSMPFKRQQFDRRDVHKLDKQIDSAYGETTTQGLDFPNQSVSPSTDIKVDTKGWVNMASEDDIYETEEYKKYKEYMKDPMNRVKQLYNFIISDVDAYPKQIASICKHLATQKHNGLYNHEIAVKAWSSCVKEEYKKYRKNVDPNFTLPINYKPKVAERLCAYFDNEVEAYRKDMFDNKDKTKIKSFLKLTAARITPKLLHLGQVLTPYLQNNSIELSTDREDQDIIYVSGEAYLINKIEHEVRDTGLYCDTLDVTPGEEFETTFSLRIFLER